MPLCTLEIPHERWANIDPNYRELAAVSVCYNTLDKVLGGLEIPNPEDREIRVLRGEFPKSRMSISFTVGPNEYPDFPGQEAFFPSEESIHTVGLAVQAEAGSSCLEVAETRMESWHNTTFIIVDRSTEATEIPVLQELESKNEIGSQIDEPKVTLVVSAEAIGGGTHLKEGESPTGLEPYRGVAGEIYRLLAETLGLPEENGGRTELLVAEDCDTRFSVEFDCQPQGNFIIPESVRQFTAKKIEQLLNNNPLTKKGSAEVWIRQGNPVVDVIPGAASGNTDLSK